MDEKELIKRSLQGEEEAFQTLVLENKAAVYRHCLSIVKDAALAEDLTQETFLHAFHHLSSFKMKSRFSTWIWRIAHNLSLNYLKREQTTDQEFKEELFIPQLLEKNQVDDELFQKIQNVLPLLSSKHRIVFEMYDLKRIPQKEIAATLGIALGTVRSRLYYARKKIRMLLREA